MIPAILILLYLVGMAVTTWLFGYLGLREEWSDDIGPAAIFWPLTIVGFIGYRIFLILSRIGDRLLTSGEGTKERRTKRRTSAQYVALANLRQENAFLREALAEVEQIDQRTRVIEGDV